jgi:hypothetical protein
VNAPGWNVPGWIWLLVGLILIVLLLGLLGVDITINA